MAMLPHCNLYKYAIKNKLSRIQVQVASTQGILSQFTFAQFKFTFVDVLTFTLSNARKNMYLLNNIITCVYKDVALLLGNIA